MLSFPMLVLSLKLMIGNRRESKNLKKFVEHLQICVSVLPFFIINYYKVSFIYRINKYILGHVINKDKENILRSALQKLNKFLSKSSLNEAAKLIDPKNESSTTIYKLFKQLDQIPNILIEEKLVLSFLPLHYCEEGHLKINSREYAKLAR